MTAYELFQQARLNEAIEAALGAVRSAPTDIDARLLLCDLLCFANQLDRADGQLEVVAQQAPDLALGVSLYRQLIRAAVTRQEVFENGRAPEFVAEVPETLTLQVRSLIAMREGSVDEAAQLVQQADASRPRMQGECDAVPFADFRDLDDLVAPALEVLTCTGKYFWVDWGRIESLEFGPPRQLRDLLWRPSEMVVRAGPSELVYVPVLYMGSYRCEDDALRIGRATDWVGTASGIIQGCGQRMFLVGDEERPILSIQKVSFIQHGLTATPSA